MNEDIFHLGVKALVRNSHGDILIMQMSRGHDQGAGATYWDLPGGRVHKGATVEHTLLREVQEETGIKDVAIGKHLGMVLSNIRLDLPGGADAGLILSIYECSIPDDAHIELSDEHTKYEWCSPAQAAKRLAQKFPAEFCTKIAKS